MQYAQARLHPYTGNICTEKGVESGRTSARRVRFPPGVCPSIRCAFIDAPPQDVTVSPVLHHQDDPPDVPHHSGHSNLHSVYSHCGGLPAASARIRASFHHATYPEYAHDGRCRVRWVYRWCRMVRHRRLETPQEHIECEADRPDRCDRS